MQKESQRSNSAAIGAGDTKIPQPKLKQKIHRYQQQEQKSNTDASEFPHNESFNTDVFQTAETDKNQILKQKKISLIKHETSSNSASLKAVGKPLYNTAKEKQQSWKCVRLSTTPKGKLLNATSRKLLDRKSLNSGSELKSGNRNCDAVNKNNTLAVATISTESVNLLKEIKCSTEWTEQEIELLNTAILQSSSMNKTLE